MAPAFDPGGRIRPGLFSDRESHDATTPNHSDAAGTAYTVCKYNKTRPIMDGFRKNNVNYWVFREIRSIIPHL